MVVSNNLAHVPQPTLYSRQMNQCHSLQLLFLKIYFTTWHKQTDTHFISNLSYACAPFCQATQMFAHRLLKRFVVWTGESSVLIQEYSTMTGFCLWKDSGLKIIFAGSCRLYQWGLKFSTVLWVCCLVLSQ